MTMCKENFKIYIDEFFDNLELYDDYKNGHNYKTILQAGIDVFLENETSYNAYEIYQTFLMIYQVTGEDKSEPEKDKENLLTSEPNIILDLTKIMKKYEENTGDLIEKQRDHFVHSVNVFLLGLAVYSQNKKYRDTFKQYVLDSKYEKYYKKGDEFSNEEFFYRWGVASLFHDIGYPVEIIGKQLKKFISDGIKSLSPSYEADTAIDFKDFNEFNTIVKLRSDFTDGYRERYPQAKFLDLFKPTDIMANKIIQDFPGLNAKELTKHLDNFVITMGQKGFIDHGFFSAILVLNSFGYLIQRYKKDYDFFFYPIVDSGTAILLHNYYRNVLMKEPFNQESMDPTKNPLAYLLILCDELQEWNRQPFGVKDREKSRINELELEIDEDTFNLRYIVYSGSMGLGFSEEKEELIRGILKIRSIFPNDLRITTHVEQKEVMREIIKSEIQTPDVLLRNVEKLAIEVHNQYVDTVKADYNKALENNEMTEDLQNKYDNLCEDFNDLPSHFKISNIRQARSIPKKLSMIGCEITLKSDTRLPITKFTKEEEEDLAIIEHDEWCDEREGTGWTYGPKKDVNKLVSPYLVPWDELDDDIKQYDIDAVKNIPHLVDSIGLKIVRTKVRLLTFKMHEFYSKSTNVGSFDDLPEYIKYSNYRQADFLVKILGELNYHVVSKDNEGEPVKFFEGNELEYLAKREHRAWYQLRINLGWKYGEERDDENLINPNLVPWEKLNDEHKNLNRNTFRNLPELCDEVGLKIIKTD